MRDSRFPDPRTARGDVVALGDDLSPETLMDAYRHGIFPWPTDEIELPWFSPRRRAILELDKVHVSRSLRAAQRRAGFRYSIDEDFYGVIKACSEVPRPGQDGTWIFADVIDAYTRLHLLGHAHSVEVWEGDELVGGVYGIDAHGVFNGESMFYRRPNASKLALLFLFDHLRSRGLDWIDIQVMTPHMKAFGAKLISRERFLDRLEATQSKRLILFP